MSDFVDQSATLDRDGEDDSDDNTTSRNNDPDRSPSASGSNEEDSSEEEDDDNEEELAKIREGFIVDDEEDENLSDDEQERRRKRRRKRHRHHAEKEGEDIGHSRNDDELDEDDLDLVMESRGFTREDDDVARATKRQKRQEGLTDMFSDEEREDQTEAPKPARGLLDEFDGFIEEDEFSDDEPRETDDRHTGSSVKSGRQAAISIPGVNEEQLGELFEIFGDGEEYAWALEAEEAGNDDEYDEDEPVTELKDVFEPSELEHLMLTDEDNTIRGRDEPERFQIMRKEFPKYELSPEEFELEESWVASEIVYTKHKLLDAHPNLESACKKAIRKVLELIVKDSLEVPFIWHHRRDYLLQPRKRDSTTSSANFDSDLLLDQNDLWRILQLDIEFHSTIEKKRGVDKWVKSLTLNDDLLMEFHSRAVNLHDYQDLSDYIQFRYAAQLKDIAVTDPDISTADQEPKNSDDEDESNAPVTSRPVRMKRPNSRSSTFEQIRSGPLYHLVRAFGISSEQFGLNFAEDKKLHFPEDPVELPLVMAEEYTKSSSSDHFLYDDPDAALTSAKNMFAEEIFHDLRTRSFLRDHIIRALVRINIHATERGKKVIDEGHQFYYFKYLRNLEIADILKHPDMFLEVLQAESQGLITIKFKVFEFEAFFKRVLGNFESDNASDIATAWNSERRKVLQIAMDKLIFLLCREIREELRSKCQLAIAQQCRIALLERLDQAPYKPEGFELGTVPRIITISNGMGEPGKDAAVAVYVDDQGRVVETIKLGDSRDDTFRIALTEMVKRRKPDVMGMAGLTVASNRLRKDVLEIIKQEDITIASEDETKSERLIELLWINDEVARLYQNSPRAELEFGELSSLARYCIALARYVQSPLLEYAAMKQDIVSIQFNRLQTLVPEELLREMLDTAFIDTVGMVGVEVNEALKVPYVANLLQFVSGLGPRKASGMLKAIAGSPDGHLQSRYDLVTRHIAGKNIFMNCASFLIIPWEEQGTRSSMYRNEMTDILDSTRIHPEDYELARKMAADALELDEEDLMDLENQGGVVAHLAEDDPEKLNELILEEYAEELLKNFNQWKRATLEMIKDELQHHYREKRHEYKKLDEYEVFTMLTGETRDTLGTGVVVPVNVRKVADRYLVVRLSCGIDGNVSVMEMTSRTDMPYPAAMFYFGQVVRGVVTEINYASFQAEITLVEEKVDYAVKHPVGVRQLRDLIDRNKWDEWEENQDRSQQAQKRKEEQRASRVIKHRLFRPFNRKQAEDYLAPLQRGDLVIRPSSLGMDHLTITWKVAEHVYQHIAVLELEKENDYSLGRVLKVGEERYSDLDELIFMHIQAMARKVDEMINSEKFQKGTKEDVEKWLTIYTAANPSRSNYAFCLDMKHAGYFDLCFKAGASSKVVVWPVKVIPNGYQLRRAVYPSVQELCNGFKLMYAASIRKR
ncbi:SH2 domain-containing protein [Lipomyces oligophaga]|uniref:SH2 domain-containing protein n=1 Tax=Lipomyces oligophaga TaxID=45792 RepID=UPI0034CDABFF